VETWYFNVFLVSLSRTRVRRATSGIRGLNRAQVTLEGTRESVWRVRDDEVRASMGFRGKDSFRKDPRNDRVSRFCSWTRPPSCSPSLPPPLMKNPRAARISRDLTAINPISRRDQSADRSRRCRSAYALHETQRRISDPFQGLRPFASRVTPDD